MEKKMVYNSHADKKQLLDIVNCNDAAEALGLKKIRKNGKWYVECPFHPHLVGRKDRHIGNCYITESGRFCKCWSCGGKGNAIDMVVNYLNLPFSEAVDWLAAQKAPQLINDTWVESAKAAERKKPCPISSDDLESIGMKTTEIQCPIGMAASKYEARMSGMDFDSILYPEIADEGDDYVILCKNVMYSPQDLFETSEQEFYRLVLDKAAAVKKNCEESMALLAKTLPHSNLRHGFEEGIHAIEEAADRCIQTAVVNM